MNEVEFAKKNKRKMNLFLLHSIKLSKNKKVFKAIGGKEYIINNWDIKNKNLKPIQYLYKLEDAN